MPGDKGEHINTETSSLKGRKKFRAIAVYLLAIFIFTASILAYLDKDIPVPGINLPFSFKNFKFKKKNTGTVKVSEEAPLEKERSEESILGALPEDDEHPLLKDSALAEDDSLQFLLAENGVIMPGEESEEYFDVKRDELIADTFLMILLLDDTGAVTLNSASLNTANDSDENINPAPPKLGNSDNRMVMVELWNSPINYQGYKFNGRKLVLYGLGELSKLDILKYKGGRYLRHADSVYGLINDGEFHAFSRIRDAGLINELTD